MTKSGGKERVGVGKPLAFWETTNTFIAKGDLDFIQESNGSKEPIWVPGNRKTNQKLFE